MAGLDQLKQTFFDECSELLQQTEAGLTEIREGHCTDDTVNAVFRAVHSVKGGAGIFGFEALVEFAHVFETVLDALRRGSVTATPEVADVLLAAGDVLSDLVQMSRSGEAVPPGFGGECRAALAQLIERDQTGAAAGADESAAAADFDGIDFVPVRADEFDGPGDVEGVRSYAITFRPKAEMLKKANEPLYIIRELRKLGELDLVAEIDALPSLSDVDPSHPYIGWTGTLRTTNPRAQIEEVFEFVLGDCELAIEDLTPEDPASEAASEAPSPPPPEPAVAAPAQPVELAGKAARPAAASETPEPASGARAAPAKAAATTTRIELDRIDRVVNMVGELVISQAMLGQIVKDLPEGISGRLSQ